MTGTIRFARILSRTDQIAAQFHGLQFSGFQPPAASWQPAVNVYAYSDHLEVCVELAGVLKRDIQIEIAPRRLVVRGHRPMPCAEGPGACEGRILIMEIADGSFERIIEFSVEIDTARVEARHQDGWLWVNLPQPHHPGA